MAVLSRVLRLRAAGVDRFAVRSFRSSSSSWRNSEIDPKAAAAASQQLGEKALPLQRDVKDRNVQWVFLGCPGVGKGTYASKLSTLLGVPHIATGDLVRDELSSSGPLAKQLEEVVNQGNLVSDEVIINLLSKRLEASSAKGETGFILDGFPRTIRQAVTTLSTYESPFRYQPVKSQPVEEFYRSRGKLLEFDLPGGIPESWPKLLRALNLEDHDDKESAAA